MEQTSGTAPTADVGSGTQTQPTIVFPDLSSSPGSPEAARAALDALRNDRMAGRVDQQPYVDRADFLLRVIAGEKLATPRDPNSFTIEEKLQAQYDDHMRPPDMSGYKLPPMGGDEATAEAVDVAVRKAFAAAQIPNHLAAPIAEGVLKTGRALRGADAATVKMHTSSVASKLRENWGDEFDRRIEGIEDLLDDMAEADPKIAAIVDRMPHVFAADLAVMTHLDTVSRYRRSKRG